MPIIHDQFQAAERIEYMHLSPQAISRKVLFPFSQNEFLIHDGFEVGDILVLIKEAVNQLERRLRMISTPLHRLKCACFGRSLRLDPRENGVENAAVILWRLFSESYTKGLDDYREEDSYREEDDHREEDDYREGSKMTLEAYESDGSSNHDGGDNADDREGENSTKECGEWQEFDCGIYTYTYIAYVNTSYKYITCLCLYQTYIEIQKNSYIHTFIYAWRYIHLYMCIYKYIYVYTYIYVYLQGYAYIPITLQPPRRRPFYTTKFLNRKSI
jgi:hypothetical protein